MTRAEHDRPALDVIREWTAAAREVVRCASAVGVATIDLRGVGAEWELMLGALLVSNQGGRDLGVDTPAGYVIPRPVERLIQAQQSRRDPELDGPANRLAEAKDRLGWMSEPELLRLSEVVAVGGPAAGAQYLDAIGARP